MRTSTVNRVGLLAAALLCWAVATAPPAAAGTRVTYRESFEQDLGGWQPDTDGRARRWLISRTAERAVDGRFSLAYYLDGTNDDGTIWIERTFPVPRDAAVTVHVSFWLYSPTQDYTGWPVVATAALANPSREADFRIVGRAGQRVGWAPYALEVRLWTGGATSVYVAVGISANWETIRTHHVDLVETTITA
jgi:hypothetical protein